MLRTEFLFLDRETMRRRGRAGRAARRIARALDGRPLIVRTLDVGADKPLPWLPQEPEANPFLGRRGLRLSLAEPALFRAQLRAILRVAPSTRVKVMFPMVSDGGELRAARALLEEERAALGGRRGRGGVMVEVPAVALGAERFAREADFLSIGTNDLAQYTMAAERGNGRRSPAPRARRPPVLALVARRCRGGRAHGLRVGVCGELAGEPDVAALLAGSACRAEHGAGLDPRRQGAVRGATPGAPTPRAACEAGTPPRSARRAPRSDQPASWRPRRPRADATRLVAAGTRCASCSPRSSWRCVLAGDGGGRRRAPRCSASRRRRTGSTAASRAAGT